MGGTVQEDDGERAHKKTVVELAKEQASQDMGACRRQWPGRPLEGPRLKVYRRLFNPSNGQGDVPIPLQRLDGTVVLGKCSSLDIQD